MKKLSYWFSDRVKVIRDPIWSYIYITKEVEALIDTKEFQKLRHISQLGHVSLVYPGARHSRFEHCLGVFHLAKYFLKRLMESDPSLLISEEDVATFLAAALLHDIGHYPFSHILEEMHIFFNDHEERGRQIIENKKGEIYNVLKDVWGVDPKRVANIIDYKGRNIPKKDMRLARILSGTLDPDKIDYLLRDSRYCGVPFGESVNRDRLINSIVYDKQNDVLAINHKGISAIESLIFTNYLMYRNVYWHHGVRSAVSMFKLIIYEILNHPGNGLTHKDFYMISEAELISLIWRKIKELKLKKLEKIMENLERRKLYKRGLVFNAWELEKSDWEKFHRLYKNISEKRKLEKKISKEIGRRLNKRFNGSEVLIDIPKFGKSLQIDLNVFMPESVCKRKANPFNFDDYEVTQLKKNLVDNFDNYAKAFHVFYNSKYPEIGKMLDRESLKQQI